MSTNPDINRIRFEEQPDGEWWVYVDGEAEVFGNTRHIAEVRLNEWFDWQRRVERKNRELHGIQPSVTSITALAATVADEDAAEIEEEFERVHRGESTTKEPREKSAWERASAHFRAEMAAAGFSHPEPAASRMARLRFLSRLYGRRITSTTEMSPEELTRVAWMLHGGEITADWTAAIECAA